MPAAAPIDILTRSPDHPMAALVGVIQELSLARDLDAIMAIVRHAARRLTGADGATFVLRDGDQCHYADEDAIAPLWKGRRFPMEICISGWVMTHRQSTVIPDIFADPRVPVEAYRPTFVRSLAMVPIRTLSPVGAIGCYWARPYQPTAEQVRLLEALADTTSVAMENVRVHAELEERVRARTEALENEIAERERAEDEVRQLSLTDDLTGLYNRRGFLLLAEQHMKLARRASSGGWLLFADLDGLKRTNDAHGHAAGDRLIESAALLLRRHFRDCDVIARLSGDEFVVLMPGGDGDPADLRARLEEAVARFNQDQPAGTPPLALSAGLARWAGDEPPAVEGLLAAADEAMYADKRRRRGR